MKPQIVTVLLVTAILIGIAVLHDASLQPKVNAVAPQPDPQAAEIQQLKARIAQLEQKPEHHYELRNEGLRTFRFDPATGESCIQLTTKEDWKKADTIRQGCPFNDALAELGPNATDRDYLRINCFYLGTKSNCDALAKK